MTRSADSQRVDISEGTLAYTIAGKLPGLPAQADAAPLAMSLHQLARSGPPHAFIRTARTSIAPFRYSKSRWRRLLALGCTARARSDHGFATVV
jgi:hypothetical protein